MRVHLAGPDPCVTDHVGVGWHASAAVPFVVGDELPFEDGAVDTLLAGAFLRALECGPLLRLLIEVRRVLRAGGTVIVEGRGPVSTLHEALALCGLDLDDDASGARSGGEGRMRLTKRDRRLRGAPLVSIAIPAYNPRYFAAALDSARAQTYRNIEIVVCDDSAGEEIEAAVHARRGFGAIRYTRNAARLGPRGNFVQCFEHGEGEFVKLLCDDDLLAPTCVEALLQAFRAPDVTLATSRRVRIGAVGEALPDSPATTPIVLRDTLIAGHTLANAMLMAGLNTLGEPSTALFRKADFPGGPACFHFAGEHGHGIIDMVMWASLLIKGNAVYLATPQSSFRWHPAQRQHDPARRERNIASIRALQARWIELGLADVLPPHLVLAKPFPVPADGDWAMLPLRGFAARALQERGA